MAPAATTPRRSRGSEADGEVSHRRAAGGRGGAGIAAAGVGAWALARERSPLHPEISAYSHGQLTRVGPYRYCKVLDLNDCQNPQAQGELRVNARDPVQLSVPPAIGRAPWWLLRVYRGCGQPDDDFYRPGSRLAVTIPTVDPQQGG